MPAELFRSDLPSTHATRRASLIPVSLAVHVAIIATAVLMPVLADGDLPPVVQGGPIAYTPVAPPPPPPASIRSTRQTAPQTSPAKAPLDAPAEISPEPAIEPTAIGHGRRPRRPRGRGFRAGRRPGAALAGLRAAAVTAGRAEAGTAGRQDRTAADRPPRAARLSGHRADLASAGHCRDRSADWHRRPRAQRRRDQGRDVLNDAALTAVRQWVFTPTRLNGEPVEVIMTVTVVFSLQ